MSQIIPLFKRIQNPEEEKSVGGREEKFFQFAFGKKSYVIPAVDITEITNPTSLVNLDSKPFVEGLMNIRGTVLPVINLRNRIGLNSEYNLTPSSKLVVVTINDKSYIGFIVDEIENKLKDGITENKIEKKLDGEKVFTYAVIDNQKLPIFLIDTWLETDEFELLEKISFDNCLGIIK